jgi:hypothetical protein
MGMATAADRVRRRIAALERWLRQHGVHVSRVQAHLDEGSLERLYWHYGYLAGLRDALNTVTLPESAAAAGTTPSTRP